MLPLAPLWLHGLHRRCILQGKRDSRGPVSHLGSAGLITSETAYGLHCGVAHALLGPDPGILRDYPNKSLALPLWVIFPAITIFWLLLRGR